MRNLNLLPKFPRSYRMTFAFSAFMLIFSVAMGYGAWAIDPVVAEAAVEQVINGKFATIAQQMANTSWWGQIMIIFTNNIMATLLIIASGALLPFLPFLIGIVPNGFIIGLMAVYMSMRHMAKSTFFSYRNLF